MATPTTPVVVSRPVAPQDWRVAKPDPAATFPTPACIPAAIDLAAMPAALNPNALIDRLEAATIPPAVETPITVLSAVSGMETMYNKDYKELQVLYLIYLFAVIGKCQNHILLLGRSNIPGLMMFVYKY
jgi:hypothetical protein